MPLTLKRYPKRSRFYYIRGTVTFWQNGQRHTVSVFESTGTDCEEEAQGVKAQVEADIRQRNTTGRAPAMTFGQAAAIYLEAGGDHRFLERILDRLEHYPVTALQARGDSMDKVDGLTGNALVNREAAIAYPDASSATLRRQWHGPIIAVLNAAEVPHTLDRPAAGKQRLHFIRPGEANQLIEYAAASPGAGEWAPALLTFLYGQGTRAGETFAMNGKRDVILDYGIAVMRDTKSGEERQIHLIPRVIAALSRLPNINEDAPLWRKPNGEPYKARENRGGQIRTLLANAAAAIGRDPHATTAHVFRHSWATCHHAQHRDTLELMHEGGWKSLAMVQIYAKRSTPALAEECRKTGWTIPRPGDTAAPTIRKRRNEG